MRHRNPRSFDLQRLRLKLAGSRTGKEKNHPAFQAPLLKKEGNLAFRVLKSYLFSVVSCQFWGGVFFVMLEASFFGLRHLLKSFLQNDGKVVVFFGWW